MSRLTIRYGGGSPGARFVDGGRPFLRREAISGGGAADPAAARLANDLLGQSATHPTVELPLSGGVWHLSGPGQLALTGADMNWRLDGIPVPLARVVSLRDTHELRGSFARNGCRAYLAIRGTWCLPEIRGSVETGLPGTLDPPALRQWVVQPGSHLSEVGKQAIRYSDEALLNCVPGPEFDLLDRERRLALLNVVYSLDPASDRQGLRLQHESWRSWEPPTQLSSAVLPGTVQLTPSGPIVLGPDAQTVGGYPRVLQVVDGLAAAYQLRPGGSVRFTVNP